MRNRWATRGHSAVRGNEAARVDVLVEPREEEWRRHVCHHVVIVHVAKRLAAKLRVEGTGECRITDTWTSQSAHAACLLITIGRQRRQGGTQAVAAEPNGTILRDVVQLCAQLLPDAIDGTGKATVNEGPLPGYLRGLRVGEHIVPLV